MSLHLKDRHNPLSVGHRVSAPSELGSSLSHSEIFQKHIAGVDFTPFAWQMKTHFQEKQAGDDGVSFLFQ